MTSFYDILVDLNEAEGGGTLDMQTQKGKVLLVVACASKYIRARYHFKQLQRLYDSYHDDGLEIIAFPTRDFAFGSEHSDEELIRAAVRDTYSVTFPLAKRCHVNGSQAHPLFKHLKRKQLIYLGNSVKTAFTVFVVSRRGRVVDRTSDGAHHVEGLVRALLAEKPPATAPAVIGRGSRTRLCTVSARPSTCMPSLSRNTSLTRHSLELSRSRPRLAALQDVVRSDSTTSTMGEGGTGLAGVGERQGKRERESEGDTPDTREKKEGEMEMRRVPSSRRPVRPGTPLVMLK
ncbi:glutathione peroxidase [Kipferlia bialata]|uniref:Glutathione peroxidase n=1 Tax=Kipferlia bialata TaxID=797122 RepID=A0A9K3GLR9_9EUKA|nr:glutathione peroxidase [Kipferlia bialata]|eukprot:g8967.t1